MKRNTNKVILLLLLIFCSCGEKDLNCSEDRNSGIIVESVYFDDWCLNDFMDQSFVISDQAQLDSIIGSSSCEEGVDSPDIDFALYTLLGIYAGGGGCSGSFIREVTRDESAHKFVYEVEVKECGMCSMYFFSMNWVLVPKLPEGWTVEFII
jgi:hypothetical protein